MGEQPVEREGLVEGEAVEVDEHQPERRPARAGGGERGLDGLEEAAAVAQPRELVGPGLPTRVGELGAGRAVQAPAERREGGEEQDVEGDADGDDDGGALERRALHAVQAGDVALLGDGVARAGAVHERLEEVLRGVGALVAELLGEVLVVAVDRGEDVVHRRRVRGVQRPDATGQRLVGGGRERPIWRMAASKRSAAAAKRRRRTACGRSS